MIVVERAWSDGPRPCEDDRREGALRFTTRVRNGGNDPATTGLHKRSIRSCLFRLHRRGRESARRAERMVLRHGLRATPSDALPYHGDTPVRGFAVHNGPPL